MENYFKMNLPQSEIDAISNLGLAHMGDCVFEILCRGYLCAQGEKTVGQLHHDTIQMVKATSQAKFADKLLPLGIPVRQAFYKSAPRKEAREKLGLPEGGVLALVMCGSMGAGPMQDQKSVV